MLLHEAVLMDNWQSTCALNGGLVQRTSSARKKKLQQGGGPGGDMQEEQEIRTPILEEGEIPIGRRAYLLHFEVF